MNNYELARLIVDDVMKKVGGNEQVFYQEYVRGVEALLNKHAAQPRVQPTLLPRCECGQPAVIDGFQCEACWHKSHSGSRKPRKEF